MSVTKAVIPAAGLGTRFLPATKATPKEMLPVVDKPAIQYVVEESVRAGLDDVLVITGRNKVALEDHFDRNWELEAALEAKGDEHRLARVRESADLGKVHFVRQGQPLGLGHAVLVAKEHVGNNPFAVLLGDDLIDSHDHLLEEMVRVREEKGGSVIASWRCPRSRSTSTAAPPSTGARATSCASRAGREADASEAPSNLAIIGRYVLDPSVFEVLEHTKPGRGNEIQLTDALQELATSDAPVAASTE